MGNALGGCCSAEHHNMTDINFCDTYAMQERIDSVECKLAPNSLTNIAPCLTPTSFMSEEEQPSIDLTDNGVESLQTSLKEYLKINRENLEQQRDEEIESAKRSYKSQALLKEIFYDGLLKQLKSEITEIKNERRNLQS